MQNITTTQLRTKSKELIRVLKGGGSVNLIHRSKVIGEIKPKTYDPKPFNPEEFLKLAKKLNLPKLSYEERDKRYRAEMERKHGKSFS